MNALLALGFLSLTTGQVFTVGPDQPAALGPPITLGEGSPPPAFLPFPPLPQLPLDAHPAPLPPGPVPPGARPPGPLPDRVAYWYGAHPPYNYQRNVFYPAWDRPIRTALGLPPEGIFADNVPQGATPSYWRDVGK